MEETLLHGRCRHNCGIRNAMVLGHSSLTSCCDPQCVWSSFERLVKIKEMVLEEKLFDPEQGNFEMSMGSLCLLFTCRVTQ